MMVLLLLLLIMMITTIIVVFTTVVMVVVEHHPSIHLSRGYHMLSMYNRITVLTTRYFSVRDVVRMRSLTFYWIFSDNFSTKFMRFARKCSLTFSLLGKAAVRTQPEGLTDGE